MNADNKAVAACPFCGSIAVDHIDPGGILASYATCSECAAEGPCVPSGTEADAIAAFATPRHFSAAVASRARVEASGEVERLRKTASSFTDLFKDDGDLYSDVTKVDVIVQLAKLRAALKGDA